MYSISQTVRTTHNQDGAIVLDIQRGQMFTLNFVASRIFELLKAQVTEETIIETVCCEFGVCRTAVAKDVEEFLEAMRARHLLESRDSTLTH
jgi:hypothetical protein